MKGGGSIWDELSSRSGVSSTCDDFTDAPAEPEADSPEADKHHEPRCRLWNRADRNGRILRCKIRNLVDVTHTVSGPEIKPILRWPKARARQQGTGGINGDDIATDRDPRGITD